MWFNKKQSKQKRKYKKRQSKPLKIYEKEEKLKFLKEFDKIGAPAAMFCKWYGIGLGTFKQWQEKYKTQGEEGLEDNRSGRQAKEVPEGVKEEIIRLKLDKPNIGVGKISEYLKRHKFVTVCTEKIKNILQNNEQTSVLLKKRRIRYGNSDKGPKRFERSKPGEMYQMDIMSYPLQGLYKLYVIACLDDYSRFIVSIGVFRRQTTDRVLDVLRGAVERYGMPKEMLTDNGRQFYTWRGKSEFQKYLQKSGIVHVRSRPYHPQTLGKVESLWRNIYQEMLSKETISSFEDMQEKIEKWIEWYNYKRPHQGIGGLVPADRFFSVEGGVREMMKKGATMVKDALIVDPRKIKEPVYLIGRIGGKEIRIIAKEGSVKVEGLDEVKEKKVLGVEDERKQDSEAGGRNVDRGEETGDSAASAEQKEETAGCGSGTGSEPGNSEVVEKESDSGDAESVENIGTGAETEELCERRQVEGELGEHTGSPGETGEGKEGFREREERSSEQPMDGEAGFELR